MSYGIIKLNIRQNRYPDLYAYLDEMSRKSKLLRNAALFRIRNNFTAHGKDSLTDHEQEVQDELQVMYAAYPKAGRVKAVLSYYALDKLMRATSNPDFFSGLPKHAVQHTLMQACTDFQNWLKALRDWKYHPEKYLGKPRMPGYVKSDLGQIIFANDECRIRNGQLMFPLTDCTVGIDGIPAGAVLKEVKCSPSVNDFLLFVTYETAEASASADDAALSGDIQQLSSGNVLYMAAVDFGVDNLAAVVTDADVPCLIYKGGAVKSANQWFNKEMARLKAAVMQGHDPKTFHCPTTRRMKNLSTDRQWFLMDFFHKIAKHLVSWCVTNHIGALILGVNKLWKQNAGIGHVNNQNFVQMPIYSLRKIIHYLCDRAGIRCIDQEESYTSKASAIDRDEIPVWKKGSTEPHQFSGKRIHRGLYRSADGTCVNADLNGAVNIGRKACPEFLADRNTADVLRNLDVVRFGTLYKVSG